MIDRGALLIAAAGEIDAHDAELANINAAKKDIYDNIRETVAPDVFKAWRDAVKLRQKRRTDREANPPRLMRPTRCPAFVMRRGCSEVGAERLLSAVIRLGAVV